MNRDRIGGIIFAAFGFVVTLMATQIKMSANLNEPGPRLFPYIAGIGMLICGVGMALTTKKKENAEPFLTKDGWKRLGVASAIMVLYYFGLQFAGFILATPIFTFAIVLVLSSGKKINKIMAAVIAILTTAILYALFKCAFSILLPTGMLF